MSLELWFDYSCPYAYLASLVAEHAAALRDEPLCWQPMLLGGVFRASGTAQNLMGELSPAKAAHNLADMQRWAKLLGAPLTVPAEHPFRTVEALRVTLAAGVDPFVVHGFYRAYWVDNAPVSDPAVLERVLRAAGHDPVEVLARAATQTIKDQLRERTDRAIALGIFGAPTFLADGAQIVRVGDEVTVDRQLLWGLDRLPLLTKRSFAATYGLSEPEYAARMPHTLDLYWDFSSPFAYLGSSQAEALAARTGATLRWQPMLLGGLFRSIGQADAPLLTWSDAKKEHSMLDMQRWAEHYDVPFRFPNKFPVSSVKAMRCWLALPEAERGAFRERTFRAYWAEGKDISDDAVLGELLGAHAADVLAQTQTPAIKQALIAATEAAVARGVFGAPTWVVDERELFWGQDRIPLVERALRAS